jgi:hypothetical protein
MPDATKRAIRERMKVTGEKYTVARRKIEAERERELVEDLDREDHPGDRNVGEPIRRGVR